MDIIPLGASKYPDTGGAVPLGPVSSNLTQAVYLTADLVTIILVVAIGSTHAGLCVGHAPPPGPQVRWKGRQEAAQSHRS